MRALAILAALAVFAHGVNAGARGAPSACVAAAPAAPFGLCWGASPAEVVRMTGGRILHGKTRIAVEFAAESIASGASATAFFVGDSEEGGLRSVMISSGEFTSDPRATQLEADYERVAARLAAKYGAPSRRTREIARGYDGADAALGYWSGRNHRRDRWIFAGGDILLGITQSDDGGLCWTIIYTDDAMEAAHKARVAARAERDL